MLYKGQSSEGEKYQSKPAQTFSEAYCQNILNMLNDESAHKLSDVTISSEDKDIKAHKFILASSSNYFKKLFDDSPHIERIEIHQTWHIVQQIIYLLYGGGLDLNMDALSILEILQEAKNLEITILSSLDLSEVVISKMNIENAFKILINAEIPSENYIIKKSSKFIANNMKKIIKQTDWKTDLKNIKKSHLMSIITEAGSSYTEYSYVESLLTFLLEWSGLDNLCDLLKSSKKWNWKSKALDSTSGHSVIERCEDLIKGKSIKKSVQGTNFDWRVEIEKESSKKFKLIFDGASLNQHVANNPCVGRFPASIFSFELIPSNKMETTNPVFICFTQDISVHWATNFNLNTDMLKDSSQFSIKLDVIENPLASLILYYLSCNLTNKIATEDIINRLPHVEYRCLASYFLCNEESKKSSKNMDFKLPYGRELIL